MSFEITRESFRKDDTAVTELRTLIHEPAFQRAIMALRNAAPERSSAAGDPHKAAANYYKSTGWHAALSALIDLAAPQTENPVAADPIFDPEVPEEEVLEKLRALGINT